MREIRVTIGSSKRKKRSLKKAREKDTSLLRTVFKGQNQRWDRRLQEKPLENFANKDTLLGKYLKSDKFQEHKKKVKEGTKESLTKFKESVKKRKSAYGKKSKELKKNTLVFTEKEK